MAIYSRGVLVVLFTCLVREIRSSLTRGFRHVDARTYSCITCYLWFYHVYSLCTIMPKFSFYLISCNITCLLFIIVYMLCYLNWHIVRHCVWYYTWCCRWRPLCCLDGGSGSPRGSARDQGTDSQRCDLSHRRHQRSSLSFWFLGLFWEYTFCYFVLFGLCFCEAIILGCNKTYFHYKCLTSMFIK